MQQALQLINPQTFFKILPCRYLQSPTKPSKILFLCKITCYRTPYRQIPLKSSISATSKPKNQTLIPSKIHPQFQNLPYLQALLPITIFPEKIPNHIGATIKLHIKLSRQQSHCLVFMPKYITTLSNAHISLNKLF